MSIRKFTPESGKSSSTTGSATTAAGRRSPGTYTAALESQSARSATSRALATAGSRSGPLPASQPSSPNGSKIAHPDIERQTHANYSHAARCYIKPHLGHMHVAKITPSDVRRMSRAFSDAGLSGSTRRYAHRVLSMVMKQAVQDRLIAVSPCDAVKPPKASRTEPEALSADEVLELLRHLEGSPVYLPALVAYDTGIRRGELLALAWDDVNLKGGLLTVRRAVEQVGTVVAFRSENRRRSKRAVKLSPPAMAALKAHRAAQREIRLKHADLWADEALVFPTLYYHDPEHPMGRVWTPYAFSKAWRMAMDDVNGKRLGEYVRDGGAVEDFEPWAFGLIGCATPTPPIFFAGPARRGCLPRPGPQLEPASRGLCTAT